MEMTTRQKSAFRLHNNDSYDIILNHSNRS